MAKPKKQRVVRIWEKNSEMLEAVQNQLPIKPSIEALTNAALSLGLVSMSKTNKFTLP